VAAFTTPLTVFFSMRAFWPVAEMSPALIPISWVPANQPMFWTRLPEIVALSKPWTVMPRA